MAATDHPIRVSDELSIPAAELTFRASRSGGPGGQHVNTSSTRIELVWSVEGSTAVTDEQRGLIRERLAKRINAAGELMLAESGSRSQAQNRKVVLERFRELIAGALVVAKVRRRTRPPAAARQERLEGKKRRSEIKRLRGRPDPEA